MNPGSELRGAAREGRTVEVTRLVRAGVNVDAANEAGWTSLMWAASYGHTATVSELERLGANVEAADDRGWTSLMFAADEGHTGTVSELVRLSANVEAADNKGWTSLMWAARDGNTAIVSELVRLGANVEAADNKGVTSLMFAAVKGHTGTVSELVRLGANVEAADDRGWTSLMFAAVKGHTGTVSEIRLGANVEAADNDGVTSLMFAAWRGHTLTVSELVRLGANVEAADDRGVTSLMLAARQGHATTVTTLVQLHGANLEARASDGRTALDFARGNNHTSTVAEIRRLQERARAARAPPPAQPPNHNPSPGPNPNQPSHDFSQLTLTGDRPLGKGSFGEVWRGNWNGTPVAVKFLTGLSPSMASLSLNDRRNASDTAPELDEFLRESGMMENMRHPNLVQFMGTSTSGIGPRSDPCIVTEFCARGSLLDVLQAANRDRNGETASALTWARRLNMALDAARGMAYLHALRPAILHRDLKSPNMLVTAQWQVKVSDFGLSKISDLVAGQTAMSTVQNINPRWQAPEVMRGDAAGRPADVFSFAVVMWELLTWEFPWAQVVNWVSLGIAISTKNARPPVPRDRSTLPGRREDNAGFTKLEAYIALMERCWSLDPDRRPGFGEIIVQLEDIKTGCLQAPLGAPPSPTTQHAAASSDGRMCVICWANPLEYAFIHAEEKACMIACAACNSRYTDNRCPTCRRAITGRARVYNAG